tara:strand:- start:24824 stop:27331 length:2508 start_codon:yes stop_codon:yes gene_type:complete
MTEEINQKLIEQNMKESYIDYAMSVITQRALPNVYDGLKPVHRRILYIMNKLGLLHTKPFRKSAFIVGRVMGELHPHGDSAIYDALVRMAQDFSLRYPLVRGQGNFGNIDGDRAAAPRYTEAKLMKIASELLVDIEKDTVDFVPNYDNSTEEPVVLPAKLPNLLINGTTGIAVGMATNIPPHNISEVIDATLKLVDNPECTVQELMQCIRGPDFPTGGLIMGKAGIVNAYKTGKGRVVVKAKADIEDHKIIITEIPYMVNKGLLIESIAEKVKDRRVDNIADIIDESDRDGMRIVIKLKKGGDPQVTLNQLFTQTALRTTFSMNLLAIHDGEPKILNLTQILSYYITHRKDVVTRRTKFDLKKAEDRAHVLEGLIVALDNIDPVIKLIKGAENADIAREGLISTFKLTKIQAQAILDMRLQRLTSLETAKIKQEREELLKLIEELKGILESPQKILDIIKSELLELKEKFNDARRTKLLDEEDSIIQTEDLIEEEKVVITATYSGYVKKVPLATYKQQRRGGRGVIGAETKEEDVIQNVFTTSNLNQLLFFTNKGRVHWLKAYEVPTGSRYARGKAMVNLLRLRDGEKVSTILPVAQFDEQHFITMVTKKGLVKKTSLKEFSNPRQGGIISIGLKDNDELVFARLTSGSEEILIGTKDGVAIRFSEQDVRPMGRSASGVRAILLRPQDEVIGMELVKENASILTITEFGFGKRTKIEEYSKIKRGGKGVINIQTTERNGKVVGIKVVDDTDEVLFVSQKGVIIRVSAKDISTIGRNTQGLRVMRVDAKDKVTTIAKIVQDEKVEEVVEKVKEVPIEENDVDESSEKESVDESEEE